MVLRRSFELYKANPILMVPPIVSMLISFASSAFLTLPSDRPTPAQMLAAIPFIMTGIGVMILMLIVSFFVLLGQAGMTGRVVTEERVSLGEWARSVGRYFFRVLGLGLIYVGLLLGVSIVVGMLVVLPLLPSILERFGQQQPMPTPILPSIRPFYYFIFPIFFAIVQSVFYMFLAPAVIDDRGVGGSLDHGFRAIRGRYKAFLGYTGLVCAIIVIVSTLSSFKAWTGVEAGTIIGTLTTTGIISSVITALFSPLFFLLAFLIYIAATKPTMVDSG